MLSPILTILLAVTGAGDPRASDQVPWNQWRGPTRDGRDTGPAWPDRLDGRVERLWRVELGQSYAGPIVTSDRVRRLRSSMVRPGFMPAKSLSGMFTTISREDSS